MQNSFKFDNSLQLWYYLYCKTHLFTGETDAFILFGGY